jgi:hypothetical protein
MNCSWRWFMIWSGIYLLNLPLLWMLSGRGPDLEPVERPWVGIVVAISLTWLFGIFLCQCFVRFRKTFIIGAALVALGQFAPLIQIFSGSIAKGTWESATSLKLKGETFSSQIAGFGITMITGQILFVACLICGWVGQEFFKSLRQHPWWMRCERQFDRFSKPVSPR